MLITLVVGYQGNECIRQWNVGKGGFGLVGENEIVCARNKVSHPFYRAVVLIAVGVVDVFGIWFIKKTHEKRHCRTAANLVGHIQIGGTGGRLDYEFLVDSALHVLEVLFALQIAFQINLTAWLVSIWSDVTYPKIPYI
jgi:hypothetical protein